MSFKCGCGRSFKHASSLTDHGLGNKTKKGPCLVYMERKSNHQPLNVNIHNDNSTNDNSNNDNSTNITNNTTNHITINIEPKYPEFDMSCIDISKLVKDIMENYGDGIACVIPEAMKHPQNGRLKTSNKPNCYKLRYIEKGKIVYRDDTKYLICHEMKRPLYDVAENGMKIEGVIPTKSNLILFRFNEFRENDMDLVLKESDKQALKRDKEEFKLYE